MKNMLKLILVCSLGSVFSAQAIDVKYYRAELPVLVGEELNHVGYIEVIKSANEKEAIQGFSYSLKGTTDWRNIKSVSLYASDNQGKADRQHLCSVSNVSSLEDEVRVNIPLKQDTSYFAFTVALKDDVALSNRINFNCTNVMFKQKEINNKNPYVEGLRVGVALRKHKQDGVHTSRIPGLTTSKEGTLLAIYDARWDLGRDLQGDIDIALNRSVDGGKTWKPMQRILDLHEWGNLPEKYNGVSDACVLSDDKTGTIYVAGLWMHGILDKKTGKWVKGLTEESTNWLHQWIAKGSQPGLDVKQTCQFLITKSEDDGKTWSEPMNITPTTKRKEWWLFAPAPGHGITLDDGTLVFPTQGRDEKGEPFSNITYSKDGGKTWVTSNPAFHNTTECMAVQLENGDIMLNMRDNRNRNIKRPNGRRICVTSDLGNTWKEHPTSYSVLTEPTCMASIHKHTYVKNNEAKTVLAFFNPNSYKSRNMLTLKLSFDSGNSWPKENWILLDQWGGAGYSCITSISEEVIGIVYEGSGAHLVFQQVNLSRLLNK